MGIKSLIRKWLSSDQPEESRAKRNRASLLESITSEGPPPGVVRKFTVITALNGNYIEFSRQKHNPHGPDEYQREIYIVRPDESLIDAISTVLVLTEK